jgi:deoxyribodipyrimidine photo-lyase
LVQDLGIERLELTRQWGTEELAFVEQLHSLRIPIHVRDHNALLPLGADDPERMATEEVFTKWRKRIQSHLKSLPLRSKILTHALVLPESWVLRSFDIETEWLHPRFGVNERAAEQALARYFESEAPAYYKETRNGLMNWGDSTKLSTYLAWGLLSPHAVLRALEAFETRRGANESTEHLRMELLWREYFRRILGKKGAALFSSRRGSQDLAKLQAWKDGTTGEDFVDAPMIEFGQTGWMSNRSRQVVASFLAKTWNVDWRLGAQTFEQQLIDYDVHSNWGNWAYVAGVGQDPRDRVFNPRLQADRYDPAGIYQSYWLSRRA